MTNIINNSILLKEIRRLVKEELEKIVPSGQIDSLWKYLNQLNEKIKLLEMKNK